MSIGNVFAYSSLVPALTAKELTPERSYWQAALERVAASIMAVLFLILSLILCAPFKKKKPLHQVAAHFERSTPTRRLLIHSSIIAAVALTVHLIITRFTPIGGLDKSWLTYGFFPQGPHLITLAFLILVLAITVARHGVRKRLSHLHLTTPLKPISWWPVLLVLIAYPLTSLGELPLPILSFLSNPEEEVPLILLAIFAFWLLWIFFRSLCGDRTNRLSQKLIARNTGYLLIVPTLVAILATPLLRLNEIKWFKNDHFLSTIENPDGLSRLESDVTSALIQRQNDLLEKLTKLESQDPPQ